MPPSAAAACGSSVDDPSSLGATRSEGLERVDHVQHLDAGCVDAERFDADRFDDAERFEAERFDAEREGWADTYEPSQLQELDPFTLAAESSGLVAAAEEDVDPLAAAMAEAGTGPAPLGELDAGSASLDPLMAADPLANTFR